MPLIKLGNAIIRGISTALPDNMVSIDSLKGNFNSENIDKVIEAVGVRTLYHAKVGQTASDLCLAAAERLISELGWNKDSIDGLLFISQTHDFITPSSSCILQNKLGLSVDCIALDINLGCSAYIYGLFMAYQFIVARTCNRVLVLVGDTLSKCIAKKDKGTALIFSDGGSATAVEFSEGEGAATFNLKCDGAGAQSLIIKGGGFRNMHNQEGDISMDSSASELIEANQLYMNGMEIFSFAVREIPTILRKTLDSHGWSVNEPEYVLLHQANKHMLRFIARNARIQEEKVLINIEKYGNISGASIPLLIDDLLKSELQREDKKVIMSGFGVGLSWGAVALKLRKGLCCPDIIYV